jgi:DnaJ-domain-containing protein 1
MRETLKLKISERRSKKDILRSYGLKADDKTPSAESAIVTQTMVDKITEEIKELRKTLKSAIQ